MLEPASTSHLATRVAPFMCGNEGTNRGYPSLSIPEGHHELSHHGNDPDKQAKISRIDRFHVERLAELADALESVRDAATSGAFAVPTRKCPMIGTSLNVAPLGSG